MLTLWYMTCFYGVRVITPAIKYNIYCHCGESRNPDVHWMPDQVRHDGSAFLNCRVNKLFDWFQHNDFS
jgi:hypothetical protein